MSLTIIFIMSLVCKTGLHRFLVALSLFGLFLRLLFRRRSFLALTLVAVHDLIPYVVCRKLHQR